MSRFRFATVPCGLAGNVLVSPRGRVARQTSQGSDGGRGLGRAPGKHFTHTEGSMIAGISPNSFYNPGMQNRIQHFAQDFQQLGQDLQAGNLSAAQADFATLQQLDPQAGLLTSTQGNPIAQSFHQLSQDLESGNLSAAQQDYLTLQQDFQSRAGAWHHNPSGEAIDRNPIVQEFSQLIEMLQSGKQAGAQQLYNSLQQALQQLAQSDGLVTNSAASPTSAGVSVLL